MGDIYLQGTLRWGTSFYLQGTLDEGTPVLGKSLVWDRSGLESLWFGTPLVWDPSILGPLWFGTPIFIWPWIERPSASWHLRYSFLFSLYGGVPGYRLAVLRCPWSQVSLYFWRGLEISIVCWRLLFGSHSKLSSRSISMNKSLTV